MADDARPPMQPSPKAVAQDFRAVATRIERLAAEYLQSQDQALLAEAARVLRRAADELDAARNSPE